jgi:hypothetical protein
MPSTPGPHRAVVRLGSPAEIVDAVPYLVGFRPERSLVVVSLRGPRCRVGLTVRVDLPEPHQAKECVRQLVPHLERNGAWRAVVVLYPPTGGVRHPAVRALADAFPDRLAQTGIELADVLCVFDGRWWSLRCDDGRCCPSAGTPVVTGEVSVLGAAMTVEGRRVLPSREALAATLEPVSGPAAAAMADALRRADGSLAGRWGGARGEALAESRDLFRAAARAGRQRPCALTDDEAARLIVGLDDVALRDEIVLSAATSEADATRALLVDLVHRAVPPFQVVPLTVLGWLAYQQGDATLAGLAVERALAADPGYGLARILADAVAAGVDPAIFRTVRDARAPEGRTT